ncbi:A/G-specific adenine glycosylase [Granulicella arctica]|uniref:A/G-specific adenine glycosylase n=1 Tax=Granulicella arctica TaxID=940613 RepID=UPI0021E07373|nr:A/G-specific adenine glycosylase [Granulicella arctica]
MPTRTKAFDTLLFRNNLSTWYTQHARKLPWRGIHNPYKTWVSEIMLQQTRVAAVIEHYHDFLTRFPTVTALAAASESDVLAAWSGLGYYRRARMMHKAAQFVAEHLDGIIPTTSTELRKLSGIGDYTCAAIASICYGESIAVVDGNVERVLLRITGRPEDTTSAGKAFIQQQAAALVPPRLIDDSTNAAGDHNQAMMELGATICLPRGPLCLQCPVYDLCITRGEHLTAPRGKARTLPAAYLLETRTRKHITEVLLEQRPAEASLMAGMYELPPLPADTVIGREPVLSLRHAITNTIYVVQIFESTDTTLRANIPASKTMLHWTSTAELAQLPLTGLARKVLQRLKIMSPRSQPQPLLEALNKS